MTKFYRAENKLMMESKDIEIIFMVILFVY